jgi:hypothetical protein
MMEKLTSQDALYSTIAVLGRANVSPKSSHFFQSRTFYIDSLGLHVPTHRADSQLTKITPLRD